MNAPARRETLHQLPFWPQFHPHAGLWFDRYLQEQKSAEKKMEPYVEHIRQVGAIKDPPAYAAFFARWQAALKKMGAQMRAANAVGRLAAGLGGESVIENGLTLHHTYGVPIIPGSSLKGTARAYAAQSLAGAWTEVGDAFRTLFGGQDRVGIAVFYDALPIPGSWNIYSEVMTVHHPAYYQGKDEAPSDWDSPTPIPFPAASGHFLIALHAPAAPEWAASGMGILQMALAELGVGGKTSSGYGRFDLTELPLPPEEQQVQNFYRDLESLPNSQAANQIHRFVNRWRSPEIAGPYKQAVAQAILDKVHEAGRKKISQEKDWYQDLESCVKQGQCPE